MSTTSGRPRRARSGDRRSQPEQYEEGGHTMAVREARRARHEDDEDARDQWTETEGSDEGDSDDQGWSENGRDSDDESPNRQLVRAPRRRSPARHPVAPGEVFNPRRAIPVGLLRLARSWSEAGSIYQAIHAYTEV